MHRYQPPPAALTLALAAPVGLDGVTPPHARLQAHYDVAPSLRAQLAPLSILYLQLSDVVLRLSVHLTLLQLDLPPFHAPYPPPPTSPSLQRSLCLKLCTPSCGVHDLLPDIQSAPPALRQGNSAEHQFDLSSLGYSYVCPRNHASHPWSLCVAPRTPLIRQSLSTAPGVWRQSCAPFQ